ncbi:hypothetical protein J7E38_14120 [Bacillus sp. ISL-35]|uniref:GLUG motif-containing protein n=1 Tax=Bacillus sp. ISL-35 TaxID=2819122 RepID=UPI001BE97D50|nr:GLUG motif-containing protein [Bacillus sp. ISL-35]MBT2680147.1 hypothetical protein [Bacillus sp. ISL-35]MBT2704421.1 hypothetical protein [Chryseobacterium sp. ISL-80]
MIGAGTASNPYLVSTPSDLNAVRNNLTAHYQLVNDIDMSSWGNFNSIGNSTTTFFKGSFDGNGFKILNLTINESSVYVGLFGYINYGTVTIKNLGIENCNINSNTYNYVGAIVGYLSKGNIQNCYSTGQINGQYGVGGLVGFSDGIIENSFSMANVTGTGRVGGLLGNGVSVNALVNKCYSTGLVTVTPDPSLYNGGLIGSHSGSTAVTNSYYDTQTSGQTISAGGISKTTAEMKTQSTFTDWDFSTIWGINGDYPYLQIFGLPVVSVKKETREIHTYLNQFITASERHTATLRSVEGYLSNIETTATRNVKTVINTIVKVDTHIQPIESFINRESKKVNELLSYIHPIYSNVEVIYPIANKQITAYLSVLFNDSSVSINEGMPSIQKVVNTSESIINNNQSHSGMIINPSHVEVRK